MVVADFAFTRSLAQATLIAPLRIIFDAVRWVRHHQLWNSTAEQGPYDVGSRTVAASQAMRSQTPDIARACDGALGERRDLIFIRRPSLDGVSAADSSAAVKPSAARSAPSMERSFSSRCNISAFQAALRAMRLSA